jgi:hypothetical protein
MTIGTTIGSSIGKSAAYIGHAAIRSAQYTGQFGADVVDGTRDGYTSKAAELAARREAAIGQVKLAAPVRRARVAAKA